MKSEQAILPNPCLEEEEEEEEEDKFYLTFTKSHAMKGYWEKEV
jgi:hypothetical protein